MKRKTLTALAVAAVAAVAAQTAWLPEAAAQASAQATPANRLVVQVSDGEPARWNMALNNVRNLQSELGASNVEVEVVAYGPGINMLKADATTANRISEAIKSGVKIVACENSLKAMKVGKEDMHGEIGYVPAGVVEIMRKQQQGWAYVRP
ncbi:DsrE family protein [Burkholderiaceae bacterium FT117]|uniref:DsrE family protein n=1 Tax=Zeimonas sediminis TaxID=2944268 RepID=UPI0023432186|nr:DsrE family protein [Zeimonas sediminis]MCM5572330.1 DsrE family protein [Zeimonas sediminis]